MNRLILLLVIVTLGGMARAQKIDSIYFHLYTDSLKKGQFNYINVDGKLADGKWMPLSEKEIQFTCTDASFDGNDLIIPDNFKPEKVRVKAVLKSNPAIWREVIIWIKKMPDPMLPTKDDIMNPQKKHRTRS